VRLREHAAAAAGGFLSDYADRKPVNDRRMSYTTPALRGYRAFIVDPVEFRIPPEKLTAKQRGEVARHFHQRLVAELRKQGFEVVEEPDEGVARIRTDLTGVANSTWWMKIHPAARATGAGTGGAAMEGEVVDSVTGQQLAAVVQAAPGNQFNVTAFTTVADVNAAIDRWVDQGAKRLKELRAQQPSQS
jgi:hypothetical protein